MTKKEQIRKSRWDHREVLKDESNRMGNEKANHPQVRRQIEDERLQRKELYEPEPEPETA